MDADFWLNQASGFVLGVVSSSAYSLIGKQVDRWRIHRDERIGGVSPLGFDPQSISFFTLNRWSQSRQLAPGQLETRYLDDQRRLQTWCRPEVLDGIRAGFEDPGGPACSLADLEIDHRENSSGLIFRMSIVRSDYADFLAVGEYGRRDPAWSGAILSRLRTEDTRMMVQAAPLSVIAANVVVLSADRKLLAIERSGAVKTSQNLWTLGPNETMNWPADQRPGSKEDLFELVQRCLWEETGLDKTEYGPVYISWIGYNVPCALVHVVALTASKLTSSEIGERISHSHGVFEAQQISWLEPKSSVLCGIAMDSNAHGRKWIDSARLAAQEYWRFRLLLVRDLAAARQPKV